MSAHLRLNFTKYRSWIFDCDGVLLDSNTVKTHAFRDVSSQYGSAASDRLVNFHLEQGGVSRYVKFRYLFRDILNRSPEPGEEERLLDQFSQAVTDHLLKCDLAPRLPELLDVIKKNANLFVVSGGMQDELRTVFAQRDLDQYFTAIFGSPDNKDQILGRERGSNRILDPGVFVGDARYDFEVADRFGLDFIFAKSWSEFTTWPEYFADKDVTIINSIADLLSE